MNDRNEIHLKTEEIEKRIIRLANGYKGIRHDFDDCGTLDSESKRLTAFLIEVNNPEKFRYIDGRGYLDAFLSLQINRTIDGSEYKPFFKEFDRFLRKNNIKMRKGNTTFVNGKPYCALMLTSKEDTRLIDDDHELIGSCDQVVEGRHFWQEKSAKEAGFYSACAAISDIGANGGIPIKLRAFLINPPSAKKANEFINGMKEAARFTGITDAFEFPMYIDESLGEFSCMTTVFGKVKKGRQTTLKGLKPGMKLYLAGMAGVSKAFNYNAPEEYLKSNVDTKFRQDVFDSLEGISLCSDVSDGVEKSLKNLLHYTKDLELLVYSDELLKSGINPYGLDVTLEDIRFGGDDYSLVIATDGDIDIKGVRKIGEVRKGKGGIIYDKNCC